MKAVVVYKAGGPEAYYTARIRPGGAVAIPEFDE